MLANILYKWHQAGMHSMPANVQVAPTSNAPMLANTQVATMPAQALPKSYTLN